MTRVKRGVTAKHRHKSLLKKAKGYHAGRGNLVRQARQAVMKAGLHAYYDRRKKKGTFRRLWIVRLNAALRPLGLNYSGFIALQKAKNNELDRKVLANIAVEYPETFNQIVEMLRA